MSGRYGKIIEGGGEPSYSEITLTQDTEQGRTCVGQNNNHFNIVSDTYIPMYAIIGTDDMIGNLFFVLGSAYIGNSEFISNCILFTNHPEDEVDVSKLKKGVKYYRLFNQDKDTEPNCLPFYRLLESATMMYETYGTLDLDVFMKEAKDLINKAGRNALYQPMFNKNNKKI